MKLESHWIYFSNTWLVFADAEQFIGSNFLRLKCL